MIIKETFQTITTYQVGSNIGLLHWDAPLKLSDSVTDYVVHVRRMSPNPERADREFASPRTTFVLEVLISSKFGNLREIQVLKFIGPHA